MDRGATLGAGGGVISVVNSTRTLGITGILTGPGALAKSGPGALNLSVTNAYSGGTVISNGTLVLGSNNANNDGAGGSALGGTNSSVTFYGGTLQLFGYSGSTGNNFNTLYNPLIVPTGQTGTLQMWPRGPSNSGGNSGLKSSLTGGGTLNLVVNYIRDNVDGNWSAFTGLINVTPRPSGSGDELRINNTFGYANAAIFLNDGVQMNYQVAANATVDIGELGGTSGASVGTGTLSPANTTWRVGGKNTSATFAGTIANDASLIKVGTGTWTLTGANTYSGGTVVNSGTLLVNNTSGNGTGSGAVAVSGGTLGGSGTINGLVTVQSGGTLAPGAGNSTAGTALTMYNNLTLLTGSTNIMRVSVDNANNDIVNVSSGTVTYAGTLTILTNATDTTPLVAGSTYTLFTAATFVGSFDSIQPPPGPGLAWSNDSVNLGQFVVVVASVAPAPVAAFSGTPLSGTAPLTVAFTDASTGSITNWIWNFGDGVSVTNSSNAGVNHSYAAGTFTVSLTAQGAGGSSIASSNNYIVVAVPAPVAAFSGTPTNGFAPLSVTFTDASTGSITNWIWSFGDGSSVTNTSNANQGHTYSIAGTNTVSLVVNGPGGSSTNTLAGYIKVVSAKVVFGGSVKPSSFGPGKFGFSGTGGPAGVQYRVLTQTNVTRPLANWTPIYTNTFNSDGSYGYTNSALVGNQGYLILVSP